MTKQERAEELFKKGFRVVSLLDENGFYETFHNKKFSQSERKDKKYIFKEAPELYAKFQNEREQRNNERLVELDKKDPCVDLLSVVKQINKTFKGKLYFKSKSGSIYTTINKKRFRFSDHEVLKMDQNSVSKNKKVDKDIIINRDRSGCLRESYVKDLQEEVKSYLRESGLL